MLTFGIEDAKYTLLVKNTIRELDDIMKVSAKERMKDLAKSAMGRAVRSKDPMFWPTGMVLLGLAEAREVLVRTSLAEQSVSGSAGRNAGELIELIDASVLRHLHLWRDKFGERTEYIDDALAGAALLKMVRGDGGVDSFKTLPQTKELPDLCRHFADRMYEYLLNAPKDEDGVIVYNASKSSNIFADGIGQTSMFLSCYGQCFGDRNALELARKQLLGFKKNGMDEKSSLPYHGYGHTEGKGLEKKGVLSWGRAAGWLIMGLSEYAGSLTPGEDEGAKSIGPEDVELTDWYRELSEALLTYMRPDGGYSWQVQATGGHLDTSATGMILYGLVNGDGQVCASNGDDLIRCGKLLISEAKDGRVGNALSSCEDFGVHYQSYGNYPWGQGAVLAALSALMGRS